MLLHLSSIQTDVSKTESEILEECIEKIAKGSEQAFEKLYRLTKDSVYGFALTVVKNSYDAEDVMHDCFVNVYTGAGGYRANGKPLAWIMTITKNLCLTKLRKAQNRQDIPEEDWEKFLENKEGVSVEDKLVLKACMEILSEEEREIVVLHAVGGFKHREISEILDMALPTVLSKYNRAIKKLKNELEKEAGVYE